MSQAGNEPLRSKTDATLLQRIAQRRDQKAFEELLQRYEQAAYRLAFRISNRPQTSEDAVQEAMIKVWQSAATFESASDDTCKAWLMKIVANQTLSLLRREARHSKRMKREAEHETAPAETTSTPEMVEALDALSGALGTLSRRDQQIIALSFGGGMSNREIGEALAMPHTTVGYRIQTALEGLRGTLARVGILGAAGITLPGLLADAVLAGRGAPVNLRGRILERIDGADLSTTGESARQSIRATASTKGSLVFWMILVLGTVGIAALWWQPMKPVKLSPQVPAVAPSAPSETTLEANTVPEEVSRMIARWSFLQGPAEDLRVVQSQWKWEDHKKKGGAMVAGVASNVMLKLPMNFKSQPIKISIRARFYKSGRASMDGYWSNHESLIANKSSWVATRNFQTHGIISGDCYFFDRYIIHTYGDHVSRIFEYEQPYPGSHICLLFENQRVVEIKAEYIRTDEIPEFIRNTEALIANMPSEDKIPAVKAYVFPVDDRNKDARADGQ